MRTVGTGGGVSEATITVNSTVIAPPGTVWMVENTGDVDLQVLVVIGCGIPGINVFENWTVADPSVEMKVMSWNEQCPPPLSSSVLTVLH